VARVVDITKKLQNKKQQQQISEYDKDLLDVADLIKDGSVAEIIGVVVDYKGNCYVSMPRNKYNEQIKASDFKKLIGEYIDKIPTYK
jgi:hypothetical protein